MPVRDDEDEEDGDAELLAGGLHQLTLRRRLLGHLRESRTTFSRPDGMTCQEAISDRSDKSVALLAARSGVSTKSFAL